MLACCQSFLQVRTCPKWSPDASTRRWTHEEKVWGQCNRCMLASSRSKKNSRLANLLGHTTYTTITTRQSVSNSASLYLKCIFVYARLFLLHRSSQERLGSLAVTSQEHPKATKPHGSTKLQTKTDWGVQYLFDTYVFEVNTPTWNRRQTRQLCNRHQTSPSKNCKYQWATVVIASGRYLWLAISRRKLMEDYCSLSSSNPLTVWLWKPDRFSHRMFTDVVKAPLKHHVFIAPWWLATIARVWHSGSQQLFELLTYWNSQFPPAWKPRQT